MRMEIDGVDLVETHCGNHTRLLMLPLRRVASDHQSVFEAVRSTSLSWGPAFLYLRRSHCMALEASANRILPLCSTNFGDGRPPGAPADSYYDTW